MDLLKMIFGKSPNNIHPADARERLSNNPKPFLLDVRTPDEFQQAYIEGAKLIPLAQLPQKMKELPTDREILVICQSGSRSSAATRQLLSAGYNAFNIQGGMSAWRNAGLPVKRKGG